eukprot:TRINITY_DN1002_c0_g1_i3.p1 TRINITY_DN1002_c0_g1~~TRINITY_DN1002_c0_g1_i3.p1  ORF type:complete len:1661 (+),score=374.68 TRINITY_DN1002_c0_g1_i3:663-4985(+)
MDTNAVIDILNKLGQIIPFKNDQEAIIGVVIDPIWLNALCSSVQKSHTCRNGNSTISDMVTNIFYMVPGAEHDLLFTLLDYFGVAFKIDERVFIPGSLPDSLPELQETWPSYDTYTLEFNRSYNFQSYPDTIFNRVRSNFLSETDLSINIWLSGMLIQDNVSRVLIKLSGSNIEITGRSANLEDCKLYNRVIEKLDYLLYHECKIQPDVTIPCRLCLSGNFSNPTVWDISDCKSKFLSHQNLSCTRDEKEEHVFTVRDVAPDLALNQIEEKRLDFTQLDKQKAIAQGGFGEIFKGTYQGKEVAIKVLIFDPKYDDEINFYNEFSKEVQLMSCMNFPNLVDFIGFCDNPFTMVLEFCSHGNMMDYVQKNFDSLTWVFRLRLMWDIAQGMQILHTMKPPIVHRDLKSPNVLISSIEPMEKAPLAKITDFGLSEKMQSIKFKAEKQSLVDNPTWLAPEILKKEPYSTPSDVYAFAIMFWETLTGAPAYGEYEFFYEIEEAVLQGIRPDIPRETPIDLEALITNCWDDSPENRYTFSDILKKMKVTISTMEPELGENLYKWSEEDKMKTSITTKNMWQKHTSEGIRNRFRPTVAASPAPKRGSKNFIIELTPQVFICEFPSKSKMKKMKKVMKKIKYSYKIYNLAPQKYNYVYFDSIVSEYPSIEGVPHPLAQISIIIRDILDWIGSSELNRALIHCDGKDMDRTYLISSSLLMHENDLEDAVNSFIKKCRISKSPSASRYLGYYSRILSKENIMSRTVVLHKIVLNKIPNYRIRGGCDPWFAISQNNKVIFFSKRIKKKEKKDIEFFCRDISLTGDFTITFYHKSYKKKMFSLTVNTNFLNKNENIISFGKADLENAYKRNTSKHFHKDFVVTLHLISLKQRAAMRKRRNSVLFNTARNFLSSKYFQEQQEETENPCYICNFDMNGADITCSPFFGISMHWKCMKCMKCGFSLAGEDRTSILSGGKLLCNICDESFFPKCSHCYQKVYTDSSPVLGADMWHAECFKCYQCDDILDVSEALMKNGIIYCKECGAESTVPDDSTQSEEDDLWIECMEFMIDEEKCKYLLESIKDTGNPNLIHLWKVLYKRRSWDPQFTSESKFEAQYDEIMATYLNRDSGYSAKIRSPLVLKAKKVQPSAQSCLDFIEREIKNTLIQYYGDFTKSDLYTSYEDWFDQLPDPDEEDSIMRASIASAVLGIPTSVEIKVIAAEESSEEPIQEPNPSSEEVIPEPEPEPEPESESESSEIVPPEPELSSEEVLPETSTEEVIPEPEPEPESESESSGIVPPEPEPSSEEVLPDTEPEPSSEEVIPEPEPEDMEKIVFQNDVFPSCASCKRDLGVGDNVLTIDDVVYCSDCLRCCVCHRDLIGVQFVPLDDKFYCLEDYREKVATKCAACKLPITEYVVNVGDKSYHPSCLSCGVCGIQLDGAFYNVKGAMLCVDCSKK